MEWKKEILGFKVMLVNIHFYNRINIVVNEYSDLAERT